MAVQKFEELVAWQQAVELAARVHVLIRTSGIADDRVVADQMWRSAFSISSNIAEGFEKFSRPEFSRFLGIAKGSCGELRSQLHVVAKIGLIDMKMAAPLLKESDRLSNLIGALRASLARRKADPE